MGNSGEDSCTGSVCNGPLQPGTEYFVRLNVSNEAGSAALPYLSVTTVPSEICTCSYHGY